MSKIKEEKIQEEKETKYNKEQLVSSKQFGKNKDLLQAILKENEEYSIKEVEKKIENFMKRKV